MPEFPDMRVRELDDVAKVFRYFGEIETPRLNSAVYTAISLGVADDPEILAMAAHVRPDQPAPNVLFASVHDLMLRNAEEGGRPDPLTRWYPSISGAPIPDESPWAAFRAFCVAHRERLIESSRVGRTQTCVVHRSAAILSALACLPAVEAARGRVGLLEIGPSAGLNLRLDHYRYVYRSENEGVESTEWGDAASVPVLVVENLGAAPPPLPQRLEIVARRGLELSPIDLSDPSTLRWLRALIWPEHVARAAAMDEALRLIDEVPAEIHQGDATRDIEAHVRALPEDAARVVFATQVFYQISKEGRREILAGLARASDSAPVDLISMESNGEGDSTITHFAFENGERGETRDLARVDSHGRSIDWRQG